MAREQPAGNGWGECPPGTLVQLSSGLKRNETRRRFRRLTIPVVIILAAVALGRWYSGHPTDPADGFFYGGISCRQVRQVLPQFVAGAADADLATKIEAHLAKCGTCGHLAERLRNPRPQVRSNGPSESAGPIRSGFPVALGEIVSRPAMQKTQQ